MRDVLLVDRDLLVGGVVEHDLADVGLLLLICVFVSAGRLTSRPRCDSGRAAMKMTSSTSSTSIIGVMFMSRVDLELLGADDPLGAEVLVGVSHVSCLRRQPPGRAFGAR